MFRFSQQNTSYPPILVYIQDGSPVYNRQGTYIIGSENDPNWKTYNKMNYPPPRGGGFFPVGAAVTDYSAGGNKYLFYLTPGQDGPQRDYGLELKRIYEIYHEDIRNRRRIEREERERRNRAEQEERERVQRVENRANVNRIKRLLNQEKSKLKQFEKELKDAKRALDVFVRYQRRNGMSEEAANARFFRENPLATEIEPTINSIKDNIYSLTNELRSYSY
jgi:hypothetical protein